MIAHTIRRALARLLARLARRVAPAAPQDVAAPVRERMRMLAADRAAQRESEITPVQARVYYADAMNPRRLRHPPA